MSDWCAEFDHRDRGSEGLRKRGGAALLAKSPQRPAERSAECAVAPARRRSRRRADSESHRDSEHAPSEDSSGESAEHIECEFADEESERPAHGADHSAHQESSRGLSPLADAQRFDRREECADQRTDERAEEDIATVDRANPEDRLREPPCSKAAEPARGRIEEK